MLNQIAPSSLVVTAECDRLLDPEQLRTGLALVQSRHPLLGTTIEVHDEVPVFATTGRTPELLTPPTDDESSLTNFALDTQLEVGRQPLWRAEYVAGPQGDRSTVTLVLHHAISDARCGLRLLQQLLRWIDRGDAALRASESLPAAITDQFPEQLTGPRGVADVLRAIRDERESIGPAESMPFHDQSLVGPRISRAERIVLDLAARERLHTTARAMGASIGAAVSAAALQSTTDLFGEPAERVLVLTATTDLAHRVTPAIPDESMRVAVGLLSTPYLVRPGDEELAARISNQTRREVERGESHLFYRIARVAGYPTNEEGVEAFATWMRSVPQNVTVSNIGVIDHSDDPGWLRSMWFALAPSPSQIVFTACTTYRDQLTVLPIVDSARLARDVSDHLADGLADRLDGTRLTQQ